MGLTTKLLLFGALVLLLLTFALVVPQRQAMTQQIIEDIQNRLSAIAATAALQIDGDLHAQAARDGTGTSPAFQKLRSRLRAIRDANGLNVTADGEATDDYLYTFSFGPDQRLHFALMTHADDGLFIGDPYPVHPQQAEALRTGRVAVSGLFQDHHGQWIAATAPIRNKAGDITGLLEVAQPADVYFGRVDHLLWMSTGIALATLLGAAAIGYWLLRRTLLKPLDELRHGMEALGRHDFAHRVRIASRDELEKLGHTLNELFGQLNAAQVVQSGFLPRDMPNCHGYSMAVASEPCDATGGDYVDAFALDDGRIAVIVADVTGHGLGPSLLMASCRAALRALAKTGMSPADLIAKLEQQLLDDLGDAQFITMIYGILEPDGRFTYTNAGHGPALLRDRDGVRHLPPHRPPLGVVVPSDDDMQSTVQLEPGDRLLLTSDGVSEARSAQGHLLGVDPICEITALDDLDSVTVIETLQRKLLHHRGTRRADDDVTILCVDRLI